MTQYPLYIPNPDAPERERMSVAAILPKSAIVGEPDLGASEARTLIYYEGNRYGATNMVTLADRAAIAAGRLSERYPTVAMASVPTAALTRVGVFTPDHGIDVPDARGLIALARWLDLFDGEQVDTDAMHRELRVSGSRAQRPAEPIRGQRRVLVLEFLTGETFTEEEDIGELVRRAIHDDLSMRVLSDRISDVDGPTLAHLTIAQGSDPSFFGLLDDGRPVDELDGEDEEPATSDNAQTGGGGAEASREPLRFTVPRAQAVAAAEWAHDAPDAAAVQLELRGEVLIASQGDDSASFDPVGREVRRPRRRPGAHEVAFPLGAGELKGQVERSAVSSLSEVTLTSVD